MTNTDPTRCQPGVGPTDCRIHDAVASPYSLPLRHPWTNARGRMRRREGWILGVSNQTGVRGWGEIAPLPAAGSEHAAQAEAALAPALDALRGLDAMAALSAVAALPRELPALRCGIEQAIVDLCARSSNVPLGRWLGGVPTEQVAVNAACGGLDSRAAERCRAAVQQGYLVLKLKVGLAPWECEAKQLERLADELTGGVRLRLDANGAWTARQAEGFIAALAGLPIECLEEPLSRPEPTALRQLQDQASFALALDESLASRDLEQLLSTPPVQRLVLKPATLGGPLATLDLARRARSAGLELVVTSTLESAIGVHHCAHLAAAIGGDLAHGLATSGWLAQDLAAAPVIERGWLRLLQQPGIGVVPENPGSREPPPRP